jgi:hypothetical protein
MLKVHFRALKGSSTVDASLSTFSLLGRGTLATFRLFGLPGNTFWRRKSVMSDIETIKINVLAYQEGEAWIAQGVEFDIYARAESLPKLPEAFGRALLANFGVNQELGRVGLEGIPPAPEKIRDAFRSSNLTLTDDIESVVLEKGIAIGEIKVAELA